MEIMKKEYKKPSLQMIATSTCNLIADSGDYTVNGFTSGGTESLGPGNSAGVKADNHYNVWNEDWSN